MKTLLQSKMYSIDAISLNLHRDRDGNISESIVLFLLISKNGTIVVDLCV